MLEEYIKQGEGTNLEFKSTIDSAWKIARTMVAFANTSGGKLIIGITDDKQLCGVQSELAEMEKIEAATDRYCEPPLAVTYQTQMVDDHLVIIVNVEESQEKPHMALDAQGVSTVYVRVHNQNLPASKSTMQVLQQVPVLADNELMESKNVKMLLVFLEQNGSISSKRFARLINISERRASKLLDELSRQGVLLMHDNQKDSMYSLK